MKMTMHLDEDLIQEIMSLTGAKSKTEAVMNSLQEMARRSRLSKLLKKGLGLTPKELGRVLDPDDNLHSMRAKTLRVAETPKPYVVSKKRSRR